MGEMRSYTCYKCGFKAELGTEQPYYVMCGSAIFDKYCPRINDIVYFSQSLNGTTHLDCQNKNWQDEFGDPGVCRNCKGELPERV